MKDSEAACATLGLSLTTTKLAVFTLSAAMAGVAGALFGAAASVAAGTDFQMFESLLILAVVAIGGASVCSGALAGGLALGFLPANARTSSSGRARSSWPSTPTACCPSVYARFNRWWRGLEPPAGRRTAAAVPGPAGPASRARDPRRHPGGLNRAAADPAGPDPSAGIEGGRPGAGTAPARLSDPQAAAIIYFLPCAASAQRASATHMGVTFFVSRGSACPQSPSSSARDGRPR